MRIWIQEFRKGPRGRWLREQVVAIVLSLLIVAVLTALIMAAMVFVEIDAVTIIYLIPVLIAALWWGVIPAVFAAIAGIAATAFFFYPPIYDFRVHNPNHIIDVVMFIIVAAVTGNLSVIARRARMRAQAERLRDALIGSVSHELRTPLASIHGSASILGNLPAVSQDERVSSLVRMLQSETERLNSHIQNLLDATRISSEGLKPHFEWIDPEDVVSGALSLRHGLLAGRQIVRDIADDLPLVYIDAPLIQSALCQLIENAVKYSPPGTPISIRASQADGSVRIEVADQGQGVEPGDRERIFERFYRSPRNPNAILGSGLGLWIARELVTVCGGRVEALSAGSHKGTTLRIDLPIETQPPTDEQPDE